MISGKNALRALLLLCLASALNGCAIVVPYTVGKIYLGKDPAEIILTENYAEVAHCTRIQTLEAKVNWGGLLLQNEAMERAMSDLTHQAAEAGADTLLIHSKSKNFLGSRASGEAYRCHQDLEANPGKQAYDHSQQQTLDTGR
jgi:hypothetical protein